MVFFFKQKTAYEMRISDWSSDVCSSDLRAEYSPADSNFSCPYSRSRSRRWYRTSPSVSSRIRMDFSTNAVTRSSTSVEFMSCPHTPSAASRSNPPDRKSVVEGKSVSLCEDHGGRSNIKKHTKLKY